MHINQITWLESKLLAIFIVDIIVNCRDDLYLEEGIKYLKGTYIYKILTTQRMIVSDSNYMIVSDSNYFLINTLFRGLFLLNT